MSRFNRKQWREPYQALILLEHLLTHGPESVASEFQIDKDVIAEIGNFQYIDERGSVNLFLTCPEQFLLGQSNSCTISLIVIFGCMDMYRFNWGFTVRKKSERILQLLEKGVLLKEERARARKLTREIKGFGSFNVRSSSSTASGSFGDIKEATTGPYGRWNSHYSEYEQQERDEPTPTKNETTEVGAQPLHILVTEGMDDMSLKVTPYHRNDTSMTPPLKENVAERKLKKIEKENVAPMKKVLVVEAQGRWEDSVETNPFLVHQGEQGKVTEIPSEDHPFSKTEHLASASLLSVS